MSASLLSSFSIEIAQSIPLNTSASWPIVLASLDPNSARYPTMAEEFRVLLYIETTGPAFFSITSEEPALYIERRLPPLKSWAVGTLVFDSFVVKAKPADRFFFVVGNGTVATIHARGRIVAEPQRPVSVVSR